MADDALPEVRASDAERERAANALRDHLTEGRLTLDELSERLDRIYAAKTRAELERAAAGNVKRVVRGRADAQSPYEAASFLELKTVWHPIGT